VERVPHTENVVRPLTFALEMSVAEASEDLFMLRIAGVLISQGFQMFSSPFNTPGEAVQAARADHGYNWSRCRQAPTLTQILRFQGTRPVAS